MSAKLMGEVWSLDLPQHEKLVALALADHGEDDGSQIFPSVARLAWKTGYTERRVQQILRSLEEKGLIEPVAHAQGGRGHAAEYQMYTERVKRNAPFSAKGEIRERVKSTAQRVKSSAERVKSSAERVKSTAIKGEAGFTPTIIDSSVQPSVQPSGVAAAANAAPPAPPVEQDVKPAGSPKPSKPDKPAPPPKPAPKTPTRRTATGQIQRTPEQHALCEELIDGLQEVTGMLRQTNRSALYTAGWTLVNLLDAGITPSKAHIVKAFGQTDPGSGQWWWYRDDQRVKIDVGKGRDAPMPKPLQVAEMYTVSLRPPLAVVDPPMGASNRKPRVIIGETLAEIRQRRAAQAAQEGRG